MNLDEIKAWPWFCPDGKPDPKWRLFTAPTTAYTWKASGGYAVAHGSDTRGAKNRTRERIWFSPACLSETATSKRLL